MTQFRGKTSPASNAGSFRPANHSDPDAALPAPVPAAVGYRAPDHPALAGLVRDSDGTVTTWGELLEREQPSGVEHVLIGSDRSKSWVTVHTDGDGTGTVLPAKVARASGLEDLTDPVRAAVDDLELARNEYDRHGHTGGFDAGRQKKAEAARQKVRELEEKLNTLRYEQDREEIHGLPRLDAVHRIDEHSIFDLTRHRAELFATHPETHAVRAIAADPELRQFIGRPVLNQLLAHPDEGVRANIITRNNRVPVGSLADALDSDSSEHVRDAARAELARRKVSVFTVDGRRVIAGLA